jgi:ABC-2 type transport system permease protein
MNGPYALIAHSVKRVRTLVLVMGLVLVSFQILLNLVAASIQRSNMFDQIAALLPGFLRQMTWVVTIMSFGGVVCAGYFHPAVIGCLVGLMIALATEIASEIETGFIDLVLSRSVARHWLVTRSIILIVAASLLLPGVMLLGTLAGQRWLAPRDVAGPEPRLLALLAINLGVLVLCCGALALALGAVSRRRAVAGSIMGLVAFSTFLLDYIARLWKPAEAVAWISPFRYYDPMDLIMGGTIPPSHLWVLGFIALSGFAAAYVLFARRDV